MNAVTQSSRLPPMWPRVALAVTPVILVVLAVIVSSALQIIGQQREHADEVALRSVVERIAPTLRDRVEVADAWVSDLAGASRDEATLHRGIVDSRIVAGVVVEPWTQAVSGLVLPETPRTLSPLSTEQRDALSVGAAFWCALRLPPPQQYLPCAPADAVRATRARAVSALSRMVVAGSHGVARA